MYDQLHQTARSSGSIEKRQTDELSRRPAFPTPTASLRGPRRQQALVQFAFRLNEGSAGRSQSPIKKPRLSQSPVAQRVIDPGLDQTVRNVETGQIYRAIWNQKHGQFEIWDNGNYLEMVDPNTKEYLVDSGYDEIDESDEGDSDAEDDDRDLSADESNTDEEAIVGEPKQESVYGAVATGLLILDPDSEYTFTFKLDPKVKEAVKARALDVGGESTSSAKKDDEVEHLAMLRAVNSDARAAKTDGEYIAGSGKGVRKDHPFLGVPIKVRLDKIAKGKGSVNPRVSKGESKDKTTETLSTLAEVHVDDLDAFLAGVRGEARQENMAKSAYDNGIEARATALISDVVDYPGNSVVTERLLANVRTEKDYVRLFTGGGDEHSYGALPSQNRGTVIEDSKERKAPFAFVGTLLGSGQAESSSAKSNLPRLRKIRSLVIADSHLLTITASAKKTGVRKLVTAKVFADYISARAMRARDEKSRLAEIQGLVILSEGEDNTDDEAKRVSVLSADHRADRRRTLKKVNKIVTRKTNALSFLEKH